MTRRDHWRRVIPAGTDKEGRVVFTDSQKTIMGNYCTSLDGAILAWLQDDKMPWVRHVKKYRLKENYTSLESMELSIMLMAILRNNIPDNFKNKAREIITTKFGVNQDKLEEILTRLRTVCYL